MKTVNHYFQTIIASGSVKHDLFAFEAEEEAVSFANDNRWIWFDENAFGWNIEIEERDDELTIFEEEDFLPDEEPFEYEPDEDYYYDESEEW